MEACMLFGLGLAVYALIVYLTTRAKDKSRSSGNGVRPGVQSAAASPAGTTTRNHRSSSPPPLPPRRTVSATVVRTPGISPGLGPRGIRASQFPCCPYCHQRNDSGTQKIFWYSQENLYHCSRGHKFHANGKPFFS